MRKRLHTGDVDGAIKVCAAQRGSAANVIRAGLERYQQLQAEGAPKEKIVAETQAAIQEANGLEVPLLERNLIALSTIASISTMVGLLGTVHRDDPLVRGARPHRRGGRVQAGGRYLRSAHQHRRRAVLRRSSASSPTTCS